MDLPPFIFALASLAVIAFAGMICLQMPQVFSGMSGMLSCQIATPIEELATLLSRVSLCFLIVTGIFAVLLILRAILMRNREVTVRGTWDCGYAAPDARMEYTGTAFSQPLNDFLHKTTGWRKNIQPPQGYFPKEAAMQITTADPAVRRFWMPIFQAFGTAAVKVRILQSGLLHLYVLIMTVTLILMLIGGYFFGGSNCNAGKIPAKADTKEVTR
jgi:hypothetical protein